MKKKNRLQSSEVQLRLDKLEKSNSRLFFLRLLAPQQDSACFHGFLDLDRSTEERLVWETLLVDDLLITFALNDPLRTDCLAVTGKTIVPKSNPSASPKRPFRITVKPLGSIEHKSPAIDPERPAREVFEYINLETTRQYLSRRRGTQTQSRQQVVLD